MSKEELINLNIICNQCGGKMRSLGEWPVQFPRDNANPTGNLFLCARYMCETCRYPHPEIEKGAPVGIAIIL